MAKAGTASPPAAGDLAPEQCEIVRRHVQAILNSRSFAGSKRTQDFLRLIVKHTLEGDTPSLRERMIGAEMFGRPVSYDTGSDSVVRVRASEVRKKLAQYYETELDGQWTGLRVELPSGSYVPRFHFEPIEEAAPVAPEAHTNLAVNPAPPAVNPQVPETAAGLPQPKRRNRATLLAAGVVLGILLLAAGYFGWRRWNGDRNHPEGIRSIAVLPLQNLSGDPAQDYFADGMTEELINDLGQVSTLRVISLTSSMSYKGTKKPLPQIARELSVEGVVEGGVVRDGNEVRISAQLIDARTDRPIWAETYVRDLTGVMAWQGDVAQAIAQEIQTKVTPQEQARLSRNRLTDPEAQDLYLHGVLLRNSDNCQDAIGYFKRAIARNPNNAQAHSALASCYGLMGESGRMRYQEAFSLQKQEASRAIELDDSLSEAYAELANTAMTLDWNWPSAEAQFQRALELNPNSATSHQKYAFYLMRTGHVPEALKETERSVDLDPVSGSTFHAEGFIYYFARQYDRALEVTRTVRGLRINLSDWNFLLGAIYAEKGMYRESIAAFLNAGDGPYTLGHLGNVYARAGQRNLAMQQISKLEEDVRTRGVGRYEIALVYAGLGEKANAFEWLEDAYNAHDVGLVYLKVDPCLDPLRSDARFNDLLRRVGLPQ
ncbi:MAG: tetratricopeptide repeat protein [Terracidiphilus sp.]